MWRCIETGEIITREQLKDEYIRMLKENPEDFDSMSFDDYIENCMDYNNGQLESNKTMIVNEH